MSNKNKNRSGIVYSTDPEFEYRVEKQEGPGTLPPSRQELRVRIEKKYRGGKTVTVVDGFEGQAEDLEDLGRLLKQKCGTGGSAKEGLILIQGEHKEKVISILRQLGYRAK